MAISASRQGGIDEIAYRAVRKGFMDDMTMKPLLPDFVRISRDCNDLWSYFTGLASGSGSYAIRERHIRESFAPILDYLENAHSSPSDRETTDVLTRFDAEGVGQAWAKALERRKNDPDGAITAAKTLVETVCKHILDDGGESYGLNDDLPKLYGKAARLLNLAPSQHTEDAFKAILNGCHTVVQNLGTLRNRIGDAHGQGRAPVRPTPRHAALAVNLAGAMATFLIETWVAKQSD